VNLLEISKQYYSDTDIGHRKKLGQYFTSTSVKDKALSLIKFNDGDLVLENSCGSGEFIYSALNANPNIKIEAYDIEPQLVDAVNHNFNIDCKCDDFLLLDVAPKYDKVIGNPPYFQMKVKEAQEKGYEDYLSVCSGKPNIYAMFIKASLDSLKPEGDLVYVVPTSMNNGNDFKKLRQYIINHANIEDMIMLDAKQFEGALQNVMILHLKKLGEGESNNGNFVFTKSGISIFSNETQFLEDAFKDGKTLEQLGFDVMTGNLVWNQNKPLMSRHKKDPKLVWACNLIDNQIVLDVSKLNITKAPDEKRSTKHEKGQYVKNKATIKKTNEDGVKTNVEVTPNCNPLSGKCVVVNRVTGASVNAKIRAAIVDFGEEEYYVENHLNYITKTDQCKHTLEQLHEALTKPEVTNFIKRLTGNTQISKKELLKLIPIKLDNC
jgi:adenine-specific DNA-methyltransferase